MEFTLIFLLRKFNNLNQKTRYIHINNIKIKSFNQRNFLQQPTVSANDNITENFS